jgi:hypothetical protein
VYVDKCRYEVQEQKFGYGIPAFKAHLEHWLRTYSEGCPEDIRHFIKCNILPQYRVPFFYGLCNEAVSSSDYIASSIMLNNEE